MRKISSFTNQYSLSKTLRFKLIPYGATLENFEKEMMLEKDVEKAAVYKRVKKYIDLYHKEYIDKCLSKIKGLDVSDYAAIYYKKNKSDDEKKKLKAEETKLRKNIVKQLTSSNEFKKMFGKEIITEILPKRLKNKDELADVKLFDKFTTYFIGFHENRKNMYSDEEKSTAIAYRCINENLPKYLDNAEVFSRILEIIGDKNITKLKDGLKQFVSADINMAFSVENFANVLTEKGIEEYNTLIGGVTTDDGEKIQGLNEYINLHNQVASKTDKLPQLKVLFKQILSDKTSVSFLPEAFEEDNQVIEAVNNFYALTAEPLISKVKSLFDAFSSYNLAGIYVKSGTFISDLSQKAFGSWSKIKEAWEADYDNKATEKEKKNAEKYLEKRADEWKKIDSLSFAQINSLVEFETEKTYLAEIYNNIEAVESNYNSAKTLLKSGYLNKDKRLSKNDDDIGLIKDLLDSLKTLEHSLKGLLGSGKEENKDTIFYGDFENRYVQLTELDRLYDKVRNYVTKKPYSDEKIKLNFDNYQVLEGWPKGKEFDCGGQIFRKDGKYYLAIMDKNKKSYLPQKYLECTSDDDVIEKMVYHQIASPSKDVPNLMIIDGKVEKKNGRKEKSGPHIGENLILEELRNTYLPADVNEIRKKRSFSKLSDSFSKKDLARYIQFYLELIPLYYNNLSFHFKNADEYESYADFLNDVDGQGYQIQFEKVSYKQIMEYVEKGYLYLFQIYSKDFSPNSKGTPNLHTLYFKMLFDEQNLKDVVYKLNGGAEMFYRFPSIKESETTIHHKGEPIKNKNALNDKAESVFTYDIIKNKRYTQPQFSLHVPITLNFKAQGREKINMDVRKSLKDCDSNYVIGIDRGERHLIYVTVIDNNGNIVQQFSGNQIINEYKGKEYAVDYHALLNKREEERNAARQDWGTIESIKELKEGYISQIVHKICQLVVKYDAVIAMEDLNSGFKNSRVKVEKQVYQKFEKMLIDKLNYMVDKGKNPAEEGGLLNAYQLTEKFESFKKMGKQNGFIFYVPAWLTSKIDPQTGFVDLLKPKYTSVSASVDFITKFDSINYNAKDNIFEFSFDYANFERADADYRQKWTVCSYGDRIETFRNKDKNSSWDNRRIDITAEFKTLFDNYGIDVCGDLKQQICKQDKKEFFEKLMHLLRLTLQMRNSWSGTEEDYLISPVKNSNGNFYDSRNLNNKSTLPTNADANGAYNIARKAQWVIEQIKSTPDAELGKVKMAMTNKEWLQFAQENK